MALVENDWFWTTRLILYSIGLILCLVFYNMSFVNGVAINSATVGDAVPTPYSNCTGNCSEYNTFTNSQTTPTNAFSILSSITFAAIGALAFGMPPLLGSIFILVFEVFPGTILVILIYRLVRNPS